MLQIESKISDRRFTNLILNFLKGGYFVFRTYMNNKIGIPHGNDYNISITLGNIFLHQLDGYILSIKNKCDKGNRVLRTKIKKYSWNRYLNIKFVRELIEQRFKVPWIVFKSDDFYRFVYVRYRGEWVIGVIGSRLEALWILKKIKEFCSTLELNLSELNTQLISLNTDSALFLGTKIFRFFPVRFSRIGVVRRLRRNKLSIRYEAPIDFIKKKLAGENFMKYGRSNPKFIWLHLGYDQIIELYNSVLYRYFNYYYFVLNYGRLTSYVKHVLKESCVKLLGVKFSLGSIAQTYKKLGVNLMYPKGKSYRKPSNKIPLRFINKVFWAIGDMYLEKSMVT